MPNRQRGLAGTKRLHGVCARDSPAAENEHAATQGGAGGIVERLSQNSGRSELAGLGIQAEDPASRSARAVKTANNQKLPSLRHHNLTGDRYGQRMGQAGR